MLLLLGTLLVALVLAGVAIAISQPNASMLEVERDAPDLGLPEGRPMTPDDVDRLRFPLALRGYRMTEVDQALDRLRLELAAREESIRRLESAHAADVPPPSENGSAGTPDAAPSARPDSAALDRPDGPDLAPPG